MSALLNASFFVRDPRVVFVTASDSSHFLSALQLLSSLSRTHSDAVVFFWDLGLSATERTTLMNNFPNVRYKKFQFGDFPAYFKMKTGAGQYAWKPVIVQLTWEAIESSKARPDFLIWTDAGNIFFRRLTWSLFFIRRHGVHTPFSTGTVRDWTHPKTIEYFGLTQSDLGRRNSHGAFVGFHFHSKIARGLAYSWAEAAKNQFVIAPEGSSRLNHRQDQAVLTCISIQMGLLADHAYRNNWFREFQSNCDVEKGKGIGSRWTYSGRRIQNLSRRFNPEWSRNSEH